MSVALGEEGSPMRDPTPTYWRIFQTLRQQIADGTYAADTRLPTEEQLMRTYGVSRHTVRAAAQQLEVQGLVRRQAGRGTFVLNPTSRRREWASQSLEDVLDRSFIQRISEPKMRVIPLGDAEETLARRWLDTTERIACFTWLRSDDNGPCATASVYVTRSRASALPADWPHRLEGARLLSLIETYCQLEAFRVRQACAAVAANAATAADLEVPLGAPLLSLQRTWYDRYGGVIEHSVILARPECCELTVELFRVGR